MTAELIIRKAFEVFSKIERPEHFTNHAHCCECKEHDNVLLAYTPDTITRDALGHMGWDPITFTTDYGFRYYLPGLIRIVLTESANESYYEQFLWHTLGEGDYDRYTSCTDEEKQIVLLVLEFLLENHTEEIDQECLSDELLLAVEKWSDKDK